MPKRKKESNNKELPVKTNTSQWDDGLAEIATSDHELKFLKLVALIRIGKSPRDAAKTVGFSDAFCNSGVYDALKRSDSKLRKAAEKLDNFTKNVASRYRKTFSPLLAPTLAEIDLKVVETLKDDPVMAIRNPQILKQLKQQGGILAEDAPAPPMINIKEIRNIMLNVSQDRIGQLPEPSVDAEIVQEVESD